MKLVREHINFERGLDPKDAMGTGLNVNQWLSHISKETYNEAKTAVMFLLTHNFKIIQVKNYFFADVLFIRFEKNKKVYSLYYSNKLSKDPHPIDGVSRINWTLITLGVFGQDQKRLKYDASWEDIKNYFSIKFKINHFMDDVNLTGDELECSVCGDKVLAKYLNNQICKRCEQQGFWKDNQDKIHHGKDDSESITY